jgi:LuxR family transcriptional regulator, quorum-sensing system regulator BjaR1
MHADLMSTIETLQGQDSPEGVHATVLKAIRDYGFEKFIVSGLPDRGMDVRPFVLLSGWDDEWYRRYTGLGYVHADPVARNCFATTIPFDWSSAPYDRRGDAAARRVMDEARDFGMDEGLCIPVHLEGGMQGVVSLVGRTDWLNDKERLDLHVLGLYAHGRLRFLNTFSKKLVPRIITPREAEVLKWVAAGKTASEIAAITGMSPRTVNQHCENAQHRLGTSNRLHTVVEAIRQKLISL